MKWLEVQLEVAPDGTEVVAAAAGEIAAGVEIRDAETVIRAAPGRALVIAHVAPDEQRLLFDAVEAAVARARGAGVAVDPLVVRTREADEDEWRDVWKQFFKATRVGRTFLVRPSWDPGHAAPGDRVIDLDPGRAFGTGGHPSTRLVIALAEELATGSPDVRRFLDLGCGSGILSIAASRLWPAAAGLAVDLDPEATACAGENFARNGVRRVELVTGPLHALPAEDRFDLVLANIQADVLVGLAPELAARLGLSGRAILSGLLLGDVASVLAAFADVGLELERREDEGEWAALELGRRRAG
jgi:ribosomal protein L11 methyltransferase